MAKEAYYFSHDANAQHDFKCIKLRRELGWEGYGLFWGLIELLRCEPTYKLPLSSIEDLSYSMHTSKEKLAAIIHRYELFEIEEEYFFSSRLLRSMNDYNSLKNRLSEAGRKGGLSKAKAELKQPPSIKGKERKVKESKVNEIKENNINQFPTLENFNFPLPETNAGAIIQLYKFTQKVDVDQEAVQNLWEVFKVQHLTGKNFYATPEKVFNHFFNWSKNQKINHGKLPTRKGRAATNEDLERFINS